MTDKNLKKGDEVSWKWGSSGHPSGIIAGMATHGSLEIESKGKRVRRNADLDNPAVHVAREGNDVVKRASELTKKSSAPSVERKIFGKERVEEKKVVDSGEKRDRSDADVNGDKSPVEEQVEAEKDTGKEVKKPKLDEKVKEKNGHGNGEEKSDKTTAPAEAEAPSVPKKRGPGRPKKSEIEARKREAAERLKSVGGAEEISQRTRSKA
ncbi:hypothetical protein Q9L58_007220 [Maublancomyces gigas]|uniref:Hypervirulence associated protein TUDOR domain-containing protein n=1 Tax=Discina gigas TaxID=1032678 RepID=A0ABR3GD14_9PEZI